MMTTLNVFPRLFSKLVEATRGPGITSVIQGGSVNQVVNIVYESKDITYEVSSRRIIYLTKFKRWWVPSIRRAVFQVQGKILTGKAPASFEQTIIFPDFSFFGMHETKFPHVRAIAAFLDNVLKVGTAVVA